MKKVDYIIVGFGIAGVCLAEHLLQRDTNTFLVVDDAVEGATSASGGVLNPTVLKRFTAAWNAAAFFEMADPFYKQLEKRLATGILKPAKIHRILASIEEQNNWMVASDKATLSSFLSSEIVSNDNAAINASFGLGEVREGVLLKPAYVIDTFRSFLKNKKQLISEVFEHDALRFNGDSVVYKDISAKHIIFAEGATVTNNPFFKLSVSPNSDRVFVGNKGEYVLFRAPSLQLNEVLKGPVMIIPLGNDIYKVGASYGRDDFSEGTTQIAREEILTKLKKMISCDFEVVGQVAGIRPTVKDRKPLLGSFNKKEPIYFMNGLGTRGLSMAPLLAKWLLDFVEDAQPLPSEVDLNRFL